MNDLGETSQDIPIAEKTEKSSKKHYPRKEFTTDQLPGLKGLSVGDKVELTIRGEVVLVSQGEDYGEKSNPLRTRVDIKMMQGSVKTIEKTKKQDNPAETLQSKQRKKELKFNKDLGLDKE